MLTQPQLWEIRYHRDHQTHLACQPEICCVKTIADRTFVKIYLYSIIWKGSSKTFATSLYKWHQSCHNFCMRPHWIWFFEMFGYSTLFTTNHFHPHTLVYTDFLRKAESQLRIFIALNSFLFLPPYVFRSAYLSLKPVQWSLVCALKWNFFKPVFVIFSPFILYKTNTFSNQIQTAMFSAQLRVMHPCLDVRERGCSHF